jgi:predicted short-subunit dehydrogenase-like oxidoreductase (DUF2520 family)
VRELERDLPETAGSAADTTALPRLVIVGRGRVGGALARSTMAAGLEVATAGREDLERACARAEAALLCVPDDSIGVACKAVARFVPPVRLVGHVSGATALDALGPAAAAGADTFSLHPLQTVRNDRTDLTGAPCAVAGSSPDALGFAIALAERLDMRPFEVDEERRAAYHAAASIASNFMVALQESAADLMAEAGIDDARELLAPLVLRTAANWAEHGDAALTGPVARGDEETVAQHLDALRETAPELLPLYEALAERTRAVAGKR